MTPAKSGSFRSFLPSFFKPSFYFFFYASGAVIHKKKRAWRRVQWCQVLRRGAPVARFEFISHRPDRPFCFFLLFFSTFFSFFFTKLFFSLSPCRASFDFVSFFFRSLPPPHLLRVVFLVSHLPHSFVVDDDGDDGDDDDDDDDDDGGGSGQRNGSLRSAESG